MRFKIEVSSYEGNRSRVLDTDDLMGLINGQLNSYTILLDPADPLSLQVTISRIDDGE